jgi:hypothetical protein
MLESGHESEISVDGCELTPDQVAAVRVSLTNFLLELEEPEYLAALGARGPLYRDRTREVLRMLVGPRLETARTQ